MTADGPARETDGIRVAMVDPSSFSRPYDHELCEALGTAGHDVELIACGFDFGAVPTPTAYQVRQSFYPWRPGHPRSGRRKLAKLAQHPLHMLRLQRRAHGFDLVHFQWLVVPAIDRRLLPRTCPVVVTAHNVMRHDSTRGSRRDVAGLLRSVDGVIVHTPDGRERLIEEVGVPADRVEVIPHGVFGHLSEQREERPLPAELADVEVPVVLMFGTLRPYKGLETLLEAWRGVRGAELWVVGDDQMDLAALRAAAPSTVRFVTRFLDDTEVPAYFRRADLVVLPYHEIDQSGVAFVALAFGAPLLLSDVGGFPELAAEGAAELVPPGDPDALREAIAALLASPGRLAELSAGSRRAAATTFSWTAIARRTTDFYRRIAPGRAAA